MPRLMQAMAGAPPSTASGAVVAPPQSPSVRSWTPFTFRGILSCTSEKYLCLFWVHPLAWTQEGPAKSDSLESSDSLSGP